MSVQLYERGLGILGNSATFSLSRARTQIVRFTLAALILSPIHACSPYMHLLQCKASADFSGDLLNITGVVVLQRIDFRKVRE